MELFTLDWGWRIIFVLTIIVVFICVMSFDMISNWEKRKRSDMVILILGITAYAGVVLAMSTKNVVTLFALISIVTLGIAGYIGATNDFDTRSSAPWELWLIAFLSIAALIVAIFWAYYYTEAGRYVGTKFDSAGKYVADKREGYRKHRDQERKIREQVENEMKKSVHTVYNPMYEGPSAEGGYPHTAHHTDDDLGSATYNSTLANKYTGKISRRHMEWASRRRMANVSEFDPLSDLELN